MAKKNNHQIVIILMGIIIIILSALCILFANDTINLENIKPQSNNPDQNQLNGETGNTNNLNDEVKRLANWFFYYSDPLIVYCGENMDWGNEKDYISHPEADFIHLYDVSQDFKSINEINSYVKTYLSDEMINSHSKSNYVHDVYKEKDGKLYCLNLNKDNGVWFDEDETTYKIIDSNDNEINVIGKVVFYETGNDFPSYFVTPIKIVKENGKWIIASYISINTDLVAIGNHDRLLNDIILNNKLNSKHQIAIEYEGNVYSSSDEIKKLSKSIEGTYYTSPNGEKWVMPHIKYDSKGYVSKVIIY